MAVDLDLVGRLAPILEIGNGVGHRAVVLARSLGRLAQRARRGLIEPVRLGREELGAVEMVFVAGHGSRPLRGTLGWQLHCRPSGFPPFRDGSGD